MILGPDRQDQITGRRPASVVNEQTGVIQNLVIGRRPPSSAQLR